MAELPHVYVEQTTQQTHTGNACWTNVSGAVIAGCSLTACAQYALFVNAQVGGSNNAGIFGFRMLDGCTVLGGSQAGIEPDATASNCHGYFFIDRVDTDATPAALQFQFQAVTCTDTVRADTVSMLALRLCCGLTTADWKWVEDCDEGAPTGFPDGPCAWTSKASLTFTPCCACDLWAVWSSIRHGTGAVNTQACIRMAHGCCLTPAWSVEPEDACSGFWVEGAARAYTLPASAQTFTICVQNESAVANNVEHYRSALFALRLPAFVDFHSAYTEAETNSVGTCWEQLESVTHTAAQNGNIVVWGSGGADLNCAARNGGLRVQVDAATTPAGACAVQIANSYDSGDVNPMTTLSRLSVCSGNRTIDLDGKVNNAGGNVENSSLISFSLELAGGCPPATTRRYGLTTVGIGHHDPEIDFQYDVNLACEWSV